jgi:hypothetical protein
MFQLWPSLVLFVLVVVSRAQLPKFATHSVARRLGVLRALNLDTAGSHKIVSLGLAMKFVDVALFSINMLTMLSS